MELKTREFLKKYVIAEDGTVTKKKNGKAVKVKNGKVKLETVKGKRKYKVSDLVATYFPKERGKEETKEEVKKVSRPQQIRNYYDADPDGFNEKECSEQLSLPPSLVKIISELHIEKTTGKKPEPKAEKETGTEASLIIEIDGKRYSINATEL